MMRFSKGKQPFGVAILNLKAFQFTLSRHLLALPHVGLEATGEASSKQMASIHPSPGCCGGNAKRRHTGCVCSLPAAGACLPTSVGMARVEVGLLPPTRRAAPGHRASKQMYLLKARCRGQQLGSQETFPDSALLSEVSAEYAAGRTGCSCNYSLHASV